MSEWIKHHVIYLKNEQVKEHVIYLNKWVNPLNPSRIFKGI